MGWASPIPRNYLKRKGMKARPVHRQSESACSFGGFNLMQGPLDSDRRQAAKMASESDCSLL